MSTPRIGVLLSDPRGWHARDLLRAAPAAGVEAALLEFRRLQSAVHSEGEGPERSGRVLAGGLDLGGLDALLVRSMPAGSLEQVVFRMDALQRLEASGVPVVNPPRAIEAAVDKHLALARIAAAGLPVPRTRVAESAKAAMADFIDLGGDTVVKPLFGSGGRGMFRTGGEELARRAFRTLERLGAVIYQQEFIPHPQGDLRVLVIDGEAPLAMRRRARPLRETGSAGKPEWRTNVGLGGLGERHALTSQEALLSVRAAAAVGAEIAGVDIIPGPGGRLFICEVNSAPGWKALSRSSGADVAALILTHLRRRAAR